MRRYFLEAPLQKEIFTTIRLTTSGICSLAGLNIEETEDFKLCVTEACLILLRHNYCEVCIEFLAEENNISAKIYTNNCDLSKLNIVDKEDMADNFSITLLQELVTDAKLIKKDGKIKEITIDFKK